MVEPVARRLFVLFLLVSVVCLGPVLCCLCVVCLFVLIVFCCYEPVLFCLFALCVLVFAVLFRTGYVLLACFIAA